MTSIPGSTDDTELFSTEEWLEITKSLSDPLPWASWAPKEYPCTCGSEKTYGKTAPHSSWCDRIRI